MTDSEEWHKVKTKTYYAEYRRGKVGELVDCWVYKDILREGEVIVRYPSGKLVVASEREFFHHYEEVEKV